MDESKQPGIRIGQIVVEYAHFGHRDDYLTLPASTPVGSLPLAIKSTYGLSPDKTQAAIRVELTTDENKGALYLVNLAIVGLVQVSEGEENMPLERYAVLSGVVTLFPFVRELVANLTGRGRFGPVWLHPVNLAAAMKRSEPPTAIEPGRAQTEG